MSKSIKGWSDADAKQARDEGWRLIRADSETVLLEPDGPTSRFDEEPTAALAYVKLRAESGSAFHERAYNLEGSSDPTPEGVTAALNYILSESLQGLIDHCVATVPFFGKNNEPALRAAENALAAMKDAKLQAQSA